MTSETSVWIATAGETDWPRLEAEATADVAILGGGLVGLTTALLMRRAGADVVVLEADRVGLGVTARSTVKVTAGHGTLYSKISSRHGPEALRAYGEANLAGLDAIRSFIADLGIDCGWEPREHWVWAEDADGRSKVEEEVRAEAEAGLAAELVEEASELPFPVTGALRLPGQAQFHPRRYVLGLADAFVREGGRIYEETRALEVEHGTPCAVRTEHGEVRAEHVLVATHFPFFDRGLSFAKMIPRREYAIAGPAERLPREMYIDVEGTRSTRIVEVDGVELLIVVGAGHKTGERSDTEEPYRELESWAREHFGLREVAYRWSTQDNFSMDSLPLIGPLKDHLWVATGFSAWGMTAGTAAALLVAEQMQGRSFGWGESFDPSRFPLTGTFVKENLKVAQRFVGGRFGTPPAAPEELDAGEAAVLKHDGEHVAAYRDDEGRLHAVSAVCTHLGCIVAWNSAELTWDCPCHGSRFAPDGAVVHAPAVDPLSPVEGAGESAT